jgi:hypothetical protein
MWSVHEPTIPARAELGLGTLEQMELGLNRIEIPS